MYTPENIEMWRDSKERTGRKKEKQITLEKLDQFFFPPWGERILVGAIWGQKNRKKENRKGGKCERKNERSKKKGKVK
jgi:hypothetical protein